MSANDGFENLSFEEAFRELEAVVGKLEEGGLTLEEALELFERGKALAAYCERKLDEAELRIEELSGQDEETLS